MRQWLTLQTRRSAAEPWRATQTGIHLIPQPVSAGRFAAQTPWIQLPNAILCSGLTMRSQLPVTAENSIAAVPKDIAKTVKSGSERLEADFIKPVANIKAATRSSLPTTAAVK